MARPMPRNAMLRGGFYDAALVRPELGTIADLCRLAGVGYVGPLQQYRGCLSCRRGERYRAPSSDLSGACFLDARLRAQRTCRGIDPRAAAGDSRMEITNSVRYDQSGCAAAQLDAGRLPDTALGAHLWLPEPDGVCHGGHHDFFPWLCFCQQGAKNVAAWVERVLRGAGGNPGPAAGVACSARRCAWHGRCGGLQGRLMR